MGAPRTQRRAARPLIAGRCPGLDRRPPGLRSIIRVPLEWVHWKRKSRSSAHTRRIKLDVILEASAKANIRATASYWNRPVACATGGRSPGRRAIPPTARARRRGANRRCRSLTISRKARSTARSTSRHGLRVAVIGRMADALMLSKAYTVGRWRGLTVFSEAGSQPGQRLRQASGRRTPSVKGDVRARAAPQRRGFDFAPQRLHPPRWHAERPREPSGPRSGARRSRLWSRTCLPNAIVQSPLLPAAVGCNLTGYSSRNLLCCGPQVRRPR